MEEKKNQGSKTDETANVEAGDGDSASASRRVFLQLTTTGALASIVSASCSKERFGAPDGGDSGQGTGDDDTSDKEVTASDSAADSDLDTESDEDTGADIESDAESDEDTDANEESDSDADDETDAESDSDSDSDEDTGSDPDPPSAADDDGTGVDSEADSSSDEETTADSEADSSDDVTTENESGSDEDSNGGSDTDSGLESDTEDTAATDTGSGNDSEPSTPPPSNRVVRVIDSAATSWTVGDSFNDYYQYGVQEVVDQMFERGLMALTNTSTLTAAWQSLIPYQEDDIIMIHPNIYALSRAANNQKNNVVEPLNAIVHGLVDLLGVPPERVAISDPSRAIRGNDQNEARLVDKCLHKDDLAFDLYQGEYGPEIPFIPGHTPEDTVTLARLADEAAHVILLPVFSWHGFNWVTGAMKLVMGSMTPMRSLHPGTDRTELQEGSYLADICMPFKNKLRLIVADGLYGNIISNDGRPHAFETLGGDGGQHPSSTIYLSRDFVAVDCVMYDDLLTEAEAENDPKSPVYTGFLQAGADSDHELGTYEMKHDTNNDDYEEIDLVDV